MRTSLGITIFDIMVSDTVVLSIRSKHGCSDFVSESGKFSMQSILP